MSKTNQLIMVAKIENGLLFLRKLEPRKFQWFQYDGKEETPEPIQSEELAEAIRLGNKEWKFQGFTPLPCGYVFTLPERDEHGNNALFSQMAKSLETPNGVYFDEDLGHNCIVHQIPTATRLLYNQLKSLP